MRNDYLSHHGILGQKWGMRNGPPYPLGAGDHSAAEKKAGYKKSIGGGRNEDLYDRHKSTKTESSSKKESKSSGSSSVMNNKAVKNAAKAGVVDPVTAAYAAIGLAYLAMIGIVAAKGAIENSKTKKTLKKYNNENKKGPIEEESGVHLKDPNRKYTEQEDIDAINPAHNNKASNVNQNCVLCSLSYELRQRGYDVSANLTPKPLYSEKTAQKVFKGAKEIPHDPLGVTMRDRKGDLSINPNKMAEWNKCRNLAIQKQNTALAKMVVSELAKEKNTRGMLCVNWPFGGGHAMHYTVDSKGQLKIIDAQVKKVYVGKEAEEFLQGVALARHTRLDNLELDKKRIKEISN